MKKAILVLAATIAATAVAYSDCGQPPANYKAIVTKYLNKALKDPDTAKIKMGEILHWDAGALPDEVHGGHVKPCWYVPVAVNGKNSFGGYSGWTGYFVWIQNGEVVYMMKRPSYM